MILHLLKQVDKQEQEWIVDILNQHTNDQDQIKKIIALMESNGSFDHAERVAIDLVESAWKKVETIVPETPYKSVLKAFGEYVIKRQI